MSKHADLYGLENDANPSSLRAWEMFINSIVKTFDESGLFHHDDQPPSDFEEKVKNIIEKAAKAADLRQAQSTIPRATLCMGCLSTDHSGFVSFDLTRLPRQLPPASPEGPESDDFSGLPPTTVGPRNQLAFFVSHSILDENRVNVLEHATIGPNSIVARIPVDPAKLPARLPLRLPSLQNPSLLDWQTSPGSFSAVPGSLVGTDGCESFTPPNLATHTFPLRQLLRIVESDDNSFQPVSGEFPAAIVAEDQVTISPIGHSLGDISYTLPLAPGESVRLVIVDWRREASTIRTEDTKFSEGLIHDQSRDRTISETVEAALKEWQRGGSVMGSVALGAGGAASSGTMGAAAGGAASIGGAYTTSMGTRDLSAETVQKVADSIHQASGATRELFSTVVAQTDEKESETIQTRAFANHNRGHTMTILYYTLLRHFHLKVEFSRTYEAVLVPRSKFSWVVSGRNRVPTYNFRNDDFLIAKQYILRPALLDRTLDLAFAALQRLAERRRILSLQPPAPWDGNKQFLRFKMTFSVRTRSQDKLNCRLSTFNASDKLLGWVNSARLFAVDDMNTQGLGHMFNQNSTFFELLSADLQASVAWRGLDIFSFTMTGEGGNNLDTTLGKVTGVTPEGEGIEIYHPPGSEMNFRVNGDRQDVLIARPHPPPAGLPQVETKISPGDYNLIEMLKFHLDTEHDHYSRVLDFAVPHYSYASEFDRIKVGSKTLLHHASPKPLEMLGDAVAFPRIPSTEIVKDKTIIDELYKQNAVEAEQRLISVPARGLFAEAKLGHCNVAEEIDDTRFWKWEEHALPLTASDIAPAQPVQPQSAPPTAEPTPFPNPIVAIQAPPAPPDPQGMAAALKAITTPDIFRDMSGIAQVQAMLHDLTETAVSMAQAASKNLENAQKTNTADSANQLAHKEKMAKIAADERTAAKAQTTAAEVQTTAAEVQNATKLCDNLVSQGKMTPVERDRIVGNQIGNMKGSSAPPVPKPEPAVPDPLRPRQILVTVRNALGAGVWGRYSIDLVQAAVKSGDVDGSGPARVHEEPGEGVVEEWADGSRMLRYTPVLHRSLFFLSLLGDVKASADASDAIVARARNLSVDVPADGWARFEFSSVVLTRQTEKAAVKSKSTDEAAEKLAVSGKLNGSVSGRFGLGAGAGIVGKALSRILKMVIKDITAAGAFDFGVEWTPFDEKKTFEEGKEFTVTYYTGGVEISEIK